LKLVLVANVNYLTHFAVVPDSRHNEAPRLAPSINGPAQIHGHRMREREAALVIERHQRLD